MASIYSVARYILNKLGDMSSMKLQKLVYYSLAWHSVWEEDGPLFTEEIQAWANGPVAPSLFQIHKGEFTVSEPMFSKGDLSEITTKQKTSIDAVLDFYGHKSGYELSQLTHRETPWQSARERAGCGTEGSCSEVITVDEMALYYSSL